MAAFLISFHNEHGICGETIVAANEDQARELWADIHSEGEITDIRRIA